MASYLHQTFIDRALGTEDYSALTAPLSTFYTLSVPVQTIGTAIARCSSGFMADGRKGEVAWPVERAFWVSLALGDAMAVGIFISSPQLVSFLSLPSYVSAFILMAGIVVTIVGPWAPGRPRVCRGPGP